MLSALSKCHLPRQGLSVCCGARSGQRAATGAGGGGGEARTRQSYVTACHPARVGTVLVIILYNLMLWSQ